MKQFIFLIASILVISTGCKQTSGEKAEVSEAQEVVKSEGTIVKVSNDDSQVSWEGSKPTGTHTGTIDIAQGTVTIKNGTS